MIVGHMLYASCYFVRVQNDLGGHGACAADAVLDPPSAHQV